MAPPTTEFVDVTVILSAAQASKFAFGTLCGIFDHDATADRINGPYASIDEVNDDGFDAASEPEVNAWATAAFSQENGVDSLLIGRKDDADANWTATLDAVESAAKTAGKDWYITNVESRTEAHLNLVAAWIEARRKIAILQSSDAGILAATAGNIALDLNTAAYKRSALIYHAIDDSTEGEAPAHGYLDGAWASDGGGFDLDAPGGVGDWIFEELSGIPFDTFTTAQTTNIYAAKANLYGKTNGLSFTSKGTMASGRFIDITTSLDWLAVRSEEAFIEAFVRSKPKLPNTNAGRNILRAAGYSVVDRGISAGHLSPDHPQKIVIPDVALMSQAEREAREITITGHFTLASSLQKVIVRYTVTP